MVGELECDQTHTQLDYSQLFMHQIFFTGIWNRDKHTKVSYSRQTRNGDRMYIWAQIFEVTLGLGPGIILALKSLSQGILTFITCGVLLESRFMLSLFVKTIWRAVFPSFRDAFKSAP